jgi:hypothetical protein
LGSFKQQTAPLVVLQYKSGNILAEHQKIHKSLTVEGKHWVSWLISRVSQKEENQVKTVALIIGLLCSSLLVVSVAQVISVKAASSVSTLNFEGIPLTDSEIKLRWPNLPSPQELWNHGERNFIDARNYQQVGTSTFSLRGSGGLNVELQIKNYTSDGPDYFHGGVIHNVNNIWLQYNSTIWVEVPLYMFDAGGGGGGGSPPQGTWALGEYSDPAQIAGSNPVSGVESYGSYGNWNPSSNSYYIGTDILTMFDGANAFQIVEQIFQGVFSVVVQAWNAGGIVFNHAWTLTGVQLGHPYPLQIQFSAAHSGWDFRIDGLYLITLNDNLAQIQTGLQPSVVLETNDYTQADFVNYLSNVGAVNNGVLSPAIAYFFSGNWHPALLSDPLPSAYAYQAGFDYGSFLIFTVGSQLPPSWFGEEANLYAVHVNPPPEQIVFGYQLSQPSVTTRLW